MTILHSKIPRFIWWSLIWLDLLCLFFFSSIALVYMWNYVRTIFLMFIGPHSIFVSSSDIFSHGTCTILLVSPEALFSILSHLMLYMTL